MRRSRCRTGAISVLLLLLAAPALAQSQADTDRCKKGHTSPDEAIAGCTAVIRAGRLPGAQLAQAYNYTANALVAKGDVDGGIANYDRAISLDPSKAIFYSNRADAWNRKGQYDRAIADADQAIRLDPRYVRAYLHRASAWDSKGVYDRALADYDPLFASSPAKPVTTPAAATRCAARAILIARWPTRRSPSGSIRTSPPATTVERTPTTRKPITIAPSPTTTSAIRLNPTNSVFHATAATPGCARAMPIAPGRHGRGDPARSAIDPGLHQPRQYLGRQGCLRPRARRLRSGHSSRPGACLRLREPREHLAPQGRPRSRPGRCGNGDPARSTTLRRPTTAAQTPGTRRATTTGPLPTMIRRSGSVPPTPCSSPTAPTPGVGRTISTAPYPMSSRRYRLNPRLGGSLQQPRQHLGGKGRP